MSPRLDIPIDEMLAGFGLTGEDAAAARAVIESAGLTNPRKRNISATKSDAVSELIGARFQRLCARCEQRAVEDGRRSVQVAARHCELCGGSNNRRAVDEMVESCRAARVERIVIVGGSPALRQELTELIGDALQTRMVDGTRAVARADAEADTAWADLVVVLGTSELAHKVSNQYTARAEARKKTIIVRRRGVEAIAGEIAGSDRVGGSGRARSRSAD